jgi:hypothetical protein
VKGRSLRIFDTWRAVLTSVSGYPHAKYKSFRHREAAQEWYLEQLQVLGIIPTDQNISEDEAGDENTVDYNSQAPPVGTNVSSRKAVPSQSPPDVYPAVRQNDNADLVDFRMAGPDPLTGDRTKIHDVSIHISSDVRDLLCPKGMTQEMQSRMLEVTPDVLTCQGKNSFVKPGSEFEIESMWNRFAGAMSDMADVQAQKLGSQVRDTQWNLPSRNSLAKVKSFEDAMELAEELASNRNSVLDNAKSNYLEILFAAGWTIEDSKIYCKQGGLTMLVTRTYNNLIAMMQQVNGKSFRYPDMWAFLSIASQFSISFALVCSVGM